MEDTSLVLPSSGMVSRDRSVRVQQQVRHTLARKSTKRSLSNGGVSSQKNTAWSSEADDGFLFDTKANGSAVFSGTLSNGHVRKATMRVSEALEPKPESSYKKTSYYRMNSAPGTANSRLGGTLNRSASQRAFNNKSVRQTTGPDAATGVQRSFHRGTIQGRSEYKTASTRFDARSSQFKKAEQKSMKIKTLPKLFDGIETDTLPSEADVAGSNFQQTEITKTKSMERQEKMTMELAVDYLEVSDKEKLITAASFIQRRCYLAHSDREQVQELEGIEPLVKHLDDCEDVRRVVAGALRNVVYENNENKVKVKDCMDQEGLNIIVDALEKSREKETKRQLTGLLWNLSAHDIVKEDFPKGTGDVLTKSVLVPSSGIFKDENPKDEVHADADAFYYATGCLRNLSCAGQSVRQSLRESANLIDSLVYYTQETIGNRITEDKAMENCVCILHNLTYCCESELKRDTSNKQSKNLAAGQMAAGSYSRQGANSTEEKQEPSSGNDKPKCPELLLSPDAVRLYVSLLAQSKGDTIVKAAIGALQNITAKKRTNTEDIAKAILDGNGLQMIMEIFTEREDDLRNAVIPLIKNLSHIKTLHPDIVSLIMPKLEETLTIQNASKDQLDEETSTCFYILGNLCENDEKIARTIIGKGLLTNILGISTRRIGRRHSAMAREACYVLHTMWMHPAFRTVLKEKGYKRSKFINSKTRKALKSRDVHKRQT